MKTFRKIAQKKWVMLFFALAFLNLSCNTDNIDYQTNKNIAAKYSGKELFKSIVMMHGEATKLFPIIETNFDMEAKFLTQEDRLAFEEMQNKAVTYIDQNHPEFFKQFQSNLYSQDPIIIKSSIENGSKLLVPFLQEEMNKRGIEYDLTVRDASLSKELKSEFETKYAKLQEVSIEAEECWAVALAFAVAIVAAVVFYVVAISEFEFGITSPENGDLFKEELTLSISNNLYL